MMKRRILVLSGLSILLLLFCFNINAYAGSYKVKKGDSLYSISRQLGVGMDEIKKTNHLSGNKLKPGQILSIHHKGSASPAYAKSKPQSTAHYTIKAGDTLSTIAKKTGVSARQIAALNNVQSKNLRVGRQLILSRSRAPEPVAAVADEDEELLDDEEDADSPDTPGEIACDDKSNEELLGKWGSADERKLFIKVSTGFLGAPYRLGGATVKGIDCSAFVRKMYSFFDIALPRTAREQSAVGVRIDRNQLEEGDLVFFRTRKPIGHVGIYIGNNEFVHASYKGKSVRIDSLDQPYFQKRFQRAVRVKGLAENDGT
ncbi:MAG: C40 family peptidase [Deltaproteobacteria bacterium]